MQVFFQVPWKIKDIITTFIIIILLLGGIFFIEYIFNISQFLKLYFSNSFLILIAFIFQWIIFLLPVVFLTQRKYGLKVKYFLLKKLNFFPSLWLAIKGYGFYIFISLIISIFVIYSGLKIPGYQIQEPILRFFGETNLDFLIAGLLIIIIAPILEELFFRGFLLGTLSNRVGIFYGSILSALIFALLHGQFKSIIPIFILGLIINYLVIKSKNLTPAIIFHILNNLIAFTFHLLIIKEIITLKDFL